MMRPTLQGWLQAVMATLNTPGEVAQKVLEQQFPRFVLIQAIGVVAILNVMLFALVSVIAPMPAGDQIIRVTPLAFTVLAVIGLVIFASALSRAGRLMGGTGTFDQSLQIIIWLQAVGLTLDVAQIVLLLVSPFLAALFSVLALLLLVWCALHFIRVLHHFDGMAKPIGTLFIAGFGTLFAVGILMSVLGMTPSGELL